MPHYVAIVEDAGVEKAVGIWFPDLPGCYSAGDDIDEALLNAQEAFARSEGVAWIYLDTYDDLKTAIALYERRGYERCARYNNNPQATLFMRKHID